MDTVESSKENPFQFTGKSVEYFKIWIVNIVLSIVTLGIYSPWAKVRTKRYFYSNTVMDGSTFEYLADPLAILKGRMIVFAVILVYYVSTSFIPVLGVIFLIAFLIGLPWLIVRSLAFNARNSAFRNVRFNFESSLGQAAIIFIVLPLFTVISFGFATPYFVQKMRKYVISNSSYGTAQFDMDATVKSFYIVYLKAFGLLLLIGVAATILIPMLVPTDPASMQQGLGQMPTPGQQPMPMPANPESVGLIGLVFTIALLLFYMFIGVYIQTATTNLVFNHTHLGANTLKSTLKMSHMFLIFLTNTLMVILSFGLLIPFARLARYRINQLNLATQGSLNDFISHEQNQVKATGEEFAEAFDIDFGF